MVDKPFTLTVAEAESLLALATAKGRVLSVFQNRRWDADFLALRQVLALRCRRRAGPPPDPASTASAPRSPTAGATAPAPAPASGTISGPHLVDQALQLFGPPRAIFLDLAAQRDGATTDDRFHAQLRYDRLRVTLHATTLAAAETPPLRPPRHARKLGEVRHRPPGSRAEGRRPPRQPRLGHRPRPGTLTTATGAEPLPGPPGDYGAYYRSIRDAFRGTGPNPVTPAEALAVMTVLELGRASDEQRRELAFPTTRLEAPARLVALGRGLLPLRLRQLALQLRPELVEQPLPALLAVLHIVAAVQERDLLGEQQPRAAPSGTSSTVVSEAEILVSPRAML